MSGVKSGVLCHSSSVLLRTCGALESKSHQQLDRCLAATVWAARHHSNMHHSLSPLAAWKPHQCTSAWRHWLKPKCRNRFIRNQRGMSTSWNGIWLKYGQQPAEFIDQSIDQWRDCFIACLRAKSKHFEHLLWCVSLWYVTVMTFKAYTTAVMNKLTCFVSQGRVRTAIRIGGQFCCKFTKVSVCQKLWKYYEIWQSIAKIIIRVQFFGLTVYTYMQTIFY